MGNLETSPLPKPPHDLFVDYCAILVREMQYCDPLLLKPDYITAMQLGGIPHPKVGIIACFSESLWYDFFSRLEDDNHDFSPRDPEGILTAQDYLDMTAAFQNAISDEVTSIQKNLDAQNHIDLTIKIAHVYDAEFERYQKLINNYYLQLGGVKLEDTELSEYQKSLLSFTTPYKGEPKKAAYIIRFKKKRK